MTGNRFFSWASGGLLAMALGACGSTAGGSGSGGSGSGGLGAGSGGHPVEAGTGGAPASSGGASPAGTGGAALGGSGGAPGGGSSGGAGGGGAPASTGGAFGSGGSPGTGGANVPGTGGGCPGIPIVPDAKGLVAAGTNSLAIRGSWFEYSDCVDLKNVNCSTVTTPPANKFPNVGGKMCTSGHTSTAAAAWGAGIGLELNDGPPQMPYDTTAHGVKGFCFQVSGPVIPSTTIRMAFPTKNNNANAYFSAISTPGQHTVLFSDTAQGSWVTTKSAFEPNAVMLVQFQIPASPGASVPWDFCIEGLTAIVQ